MTTTTMSAGYERARSRLREAGQEHALRFWDELDAQGRSALLAQIESLDLEGLGSLIERYVRNREIPALPADLAPAQCYTLDGAWDRGGYRARGEEMLRAGKVAAFTVAGGQGTRLGFDGPKGAFPGGAVTGMPLFACLAQWLLAARDRFGRDVPWYVMTSPLNHAQTIALFESWGYFGLDRADVKFFSQGVLPSLDIESGNLLLASKGEIATNPDGHGGSLRALAASGALADMRRRGIEHFSYVQIDNPLARVIDPVFIGLHAHTPDSSAEMSSKMVAKSEPGEKVGVFCRSGGRLRIIEYSDLPRELMEARDGQSRLLFGAGSIAIHMIGVAFAERLTAGVGGGVEGGVGGSALPLHRAEKIVPHINLETGAFVEPAKPNAVKLEAFVFDALPLARASIVYEARRLDEFAPIKNAQGNDSPETCARIQTERAARWLEAAGVSVPRDAEGRAECALEISPRTAMTSEELKAIGNKLPPSIERGARIAL